MELADDLERLVALHGAETIAACIVEPVAGSTGVLSRRKAISTACARSATATAFSSSSTRSLPASADSALPLPRTISVLPPDIVTTAKGLTNGAIPMGAVFTSRDVHDALMHGPEGQIELFHGYTYSGHPAACAAGLATLDIYRDEGLLTRAAELETIGTRPCTR